MIYHSLISLFFLSISCLSMSSEITIIDSFEYINESEAQKAWIPQNRSTNVSIGLHETEYGKQAMMMNCNFSQIEDRCYWDKEVDLNLTKFGRFSLWVYSDKPSAISGCTLYFQSGDGWFSGGFGASRIGWQKIILRKSDFVVEGKPRGWDEIKRIRLSFWKGQNQDTIIGVDDLIAIADDIVIVMGDLTFQKNPSEARTVREFADSMSQMLDESGLQFGVVTDTDVESGVLSGCKIAIFPYNPDISTKEISAIKQFVESDGKLLIFYSLPAEIAQILGIKNSGWMRRQYPGQFSTIKLMPEIVEGLPESIYQDSWNITIPEPESNEAKIVGKWIDAEGKDTGLPAITFNSNGVFMGHVLLKRDIANKRQMLLALLGQLEPEMRNVLSESVLKNAGKIAGFESFEEVAHFIKANLEKIPENRQKEALYHIDKSSLMFEQAKQTDKYVEILKIVRSASAELQEALFYSFPSKKDEFRALWCHSAFGIPGWDWEKAIRTIKENGFNAIVPNMLWGGLAYYPSEILPVAPEIQEKGDQIIQCLSACKKYGVQTHIWKVNWNLSNAPEEFVEKIRKEGRLQRDKNGNEIRWLCPSHEDNYRIELESMLEIVKKYNVDGIHFDYIRYPHGDSCYCETCKEKFEKWIGEEVEQWPKGVIDGKYKEKYVQYRCDQITRLVKAVSEKAREINPDIKISAAVFSDYPRCRETVGQDWGFWVKSGYLDFVCPMDYTANNDHFRNIVTNQIRIVNNQIPLYPGIGASAPGLTPDQVAIQTHIARELGAKGFIIFNYDLTVANYVLPALLKGITSE